MISVTFCSARICKICLFMLSVTFCSACICKVCYLCLRWLFVLLASARFVLYAFGDFLCCSHLQDLFFMPSCDFLCCSHLQILFFMPRVTFCVDWICTQVQEHTDKSDMQLSTAQMRTKTLDPQPGHDITTKSSKTKPAQRELCIAVAKATKLPWGHLWTWRFCIQTHTGTIAQVTSRCLLAQTKRVPMRAWGCCSRAWMGDLIAVCNGCMGVALRISCPGL